MKINAPIQSDSYRNISKNELSALLYRLLNQYTNLWFEATDPKTLYELRSKIKAIQKKLKEKEAEDNQ